MQTIILDIQRPGITQAINAKADDAYSRFFAAELYDGGAAYSPPAGAAYMLRYKTPGGQGWYDTVTQGGVSRAACTVSGNAVTCEIAPEVLGTAGAGILCLQIYTSAGYKLGAWNIPISIQADPVPDGTIINGDYYSTLTQQVAQALAYRDAAQTSAAAAAQSAEALANVYTKTQADAAFLPQSAKGAAGGVMALPTPLPATGALLKMAAGGTVDGVTFRKGVWTPTLFGDSTAGSPTYALQSGYFIQIDNFIIAIINALSISAIGGMAGGLCIGGLPYAAAYNGSAPVAQFGGTSVSQIALRVDGGHNYCHAFTSGGFLSVSSITSSFYMYGVSIPYIAS